MRAVERQDRTGFRRTPGNAPVTVRPRKNTVRIRIDQDVPPERQPVSDETGFIRFAVFQRIGEKTRRPEGIARRMRHVILRYHLWGTEIFIHGKRNRHPAALTFFRLPDHPVIVAYPADKQKSEPFDYSGQALRNAVRVQAANRVAFCRIIPVSTHLERLDGL